MKSNTFALATQSVGLFLLFFLMMHSVGYAENPWALGQAAPDQKEIQNYGKLKLSNLSGKAPLKVRVVGPQQMIDHGVGKPQKWDGCRMYVIWGDGPLEQAQNCSEYLEHTYKTAGVFTVKATIYHLGPADESITDWKDEVAVTVEK